MKVVELKSLAREQGLRGYSRLRKAELINLLENVVPIPPPIGVLRRAVENGDIEIVKNCKERGVADFNEAMSSAAL